MVIRGVLGRAFRRRVGGPGAGHGAVLALGAVLAVAAQLAAPVARPLYDGLTVTDPYRYLDPGSGQTGSPTSYAKDLAVANGQSPEITAATGENPPQAQLVALGGTFQVPAGVTSIHVSIAPVASSAAPTKGSVSGNVYRIAATTPDGQAMTVAPGQQATVVLRGTGTEADGAVMQLVAGAWQPTNGEQSASLGIYTAQVTGLGDFAVVDRAAGALSQTTVVIAATIAVVIGAGAIFVIRLVLRRRAEAEAQAAAASRRRAAPKASNRRPPRRH